MATLESKQRVCATCKWWVAKQAIEDGGAIGEDAGECACPCGGLYGIPITKYATCDCWTVHR